VLVDNNPIEEAEKIVEGYKDSPKIVNKDDNRAYYNPFFDFINMPVMGKFNKVEEYYSTIFHEMIHSTGHTNRLKRLDNQKSAAFGSEDYSKEELVAEFGAAMLCGIAGIENSTIENSTAYIQSWLKALRDDKTLAVKAAAQAQKAADYILGTMFQEEEGESN
jgi:antirestriction protein ArdC